MKASEMGNHTACQRLAEALHGACVALEQARNEAGQPRPADEPDPGQAAHWTDQVGRHIALAIAAVPDSVLRAWLLDERTVGGDEVYRTLRAGAGTRAVGKAVAA